MKLLVYMDSHSNDRANIEEHLRYYTCDRLYDLLFTRNTPYTYQVTDRDITWNGSPCPTVLLSVDTSPGEEMLFRLENKYDFADA